MRKVVLQERLEVGPQRGAHPMEAWISRVLRLGVGVAALIILAGLVIHVAKGPHFASVSELLRQGQTSVTMGGILKGVARADAASLIQLGLIVLILTPVSRVAMSVLLFGLQRDVIFVLITSVVLTILVLGIAGVI